MPSTDRASQPGTAVAIAATIRRNGVGSQTDKDFAGRGGRTRMIPPIVRGEPAEKGRLSISKQASSTNRNLGAFVPFKVVTRSKERPLVNVNKNPKEKQPGENPDGKYHFNPGNMAGKKPGDSEQTAENRGEPPHEDKEKPAG
jgi:hypothetical protein